MQDEAILQESGALREALGKFRTRREWLASREGAELAARLARFMAPVRRHAPAATAPLGRGPGRDWIHSVHWNILHGGRYAGIVASLRREPALARADVLALNEVDLGLARSANRDVARDLAADLGLHAVWAATFLELEGGFGTPPELARAPQRESLMGSALLSRFPLGEARRIVLETPEDLLFDRERKAGSFIALVVEVLWPGSPFHVLVTHLDVHGTPERRERQMQAALDALPRGAALVSGDLNTTTFARGTWGRSASALAVLALAPPAYLRGRLLRPHGPAGKPREPLFTVLARAGFEHAPFNDGGPTLDLRLEDVHELQSLPAPVRRLGRGLLRHVERRTHHRLDWIAARGFEPAPERAPFTLMHLARGAEAVSDHAAIGCGVRLARTSHVGAPRVGASEVGTTEVGTSQVGASQEGAGSAELRSASNPPALPGSRVPEA